MKTVAGLYEDATATRVAAELVGAGFDRSAVNLHTKSAGGTLADLSARGIPMEDGKRYIAQLASGGTLVTVDTVDTDTPKALKIMSGHCARDYTREAASRDTIPVIDEQLEVGKQDLETGGLRVHARIVETPVEEDVVLRAEHVDVERRRVDRPVTAADYEPGELSMIEHAEEAVAAKRAHVVEEVRLGKTVEEHIETIHDTVRHTKVDVAKRPRRAPAAATTAGPELAKGRRGSDGIPIVEEELQVGKREYESGGVTVRSNIVEEPVEKDVSLRTEHAYVDHRAVDRPASDADFAPQDIEMVEHGEKAFATKTAHVVEEVRLGKTVDEQKQKVRGTVRHTEIDVEDRRNLRGWDLASKQYRSHFDRTFGPAGNTTWQQYEPAYRFGHELGSGRGEWTSIEGDARARWEARNPGTWERVKDAVREAFARAREGIAAHRHP